MTGAAYRRAVVAAVLSPGPDRRVRVVPDPEDRGRDLFVLSQLIEGHWHDMHSVCRYEDDRLSSL